MRRVTRAKEREHGRQRRYFEDDIEQPIDRRTGKRNRRYEKIYGEYKKSNLTTRDLYDIDYEEDL